MQRAKPRGCRPAVVGRTADVQPAKTKQAASVSAQGPAEPKPKAGCIINQRLRDEVPWTPKEGQTPAQAAEHQRPRSTGLCRRTVGPQVSRRSRRCTYARQPLSPVTTAPPSSPQRADHPADPSHRPQRIRWSPTRSTRWLTRDARVRAARSRTSTRLAASQRNDVWSGSWAGASAQH